MLDQYWEYAGTRYRHKFKAFEASRGDFTNIHYNLFKHNHFETFDWTVEPVESFNELMVERARQLRDTYPYLKFWLSGGADSSTALRVFLDNNIFIDEIITYKFAPNNNDTDPGDYELEEYTIPYLKKLQSTIPKTKINIITYDKSYFDSYLGEKWFHTRNALSLRHAHMPKIKGKNFCNIICDGEPVVEKIAGKWYAELWDTDNYLEFGLFRNVECFYTTPEFPKLHAKQCHIMKKVLQENHSQRPKYSTWKDLMRQHVRGTPIAPEPIFFRKEITKKYSESFMSQKDKFTYRIMSDTHRDKYRYVLNTPIGGQKLFRVLTGFKGFSYCLEK